MINMQEFEVIGTFKMGEAWRPYTKVVSAPNEKQAKERVFTLMGSKHRLRRQYITISDVKVYIRE